MSQKMALQNMDFTFYFKKRDWTLIGEYFYKKVLKKPQTKKYVYALMLTCRKLKSKNCLFKTPLPRGNLFESVGAPSLHNTK